MCNWEKIGSLKKDSGVLKNSVFHYFLLRLSIFPNLMAVVAGKKIVDGSLDVAFESWSRRHVGIITGSSWENYDDSCKLCTSGCCSHYFPYQTLLFHIKLVRSMLGWLFRDPFPVDVDPPGNPAFAARPVSLGTKVGHMDNEMEMESLSFGFWFA